MAEITATFIRKLTHFNGDAALYRLSAPVPDYYNKLTYYVVISAVSSAVTMGHPETYIFPADSGGDVTCYLEMEGSFKGAMDHNEAISLAGWTLA